MPAPVGTPTWWQQMAARGIPVVEPDAAPGAPIEVTFLWRDPHGDASASPLARVYIDINSVTDHHSADPQSLERLPGTDAWSWTVTLPSDFRGSYSFIPVREEQLPRFDPVDRSAQRQWWRSIVELAEGDAFNPGYPSGAHVSVLSLPEAPDQSAWINLDREARGADPVRLKELHWHSALLGEKRRAWVYRTGDGTASLPVVWLLDGQRWALQQPIFSALDTDTRRRRVAPAVYVLIDAIDGDKRERDLTCNRTFWDALHEELEPQLVQAAGCAIAHERGVVAGQSLGGLAATFAALTYPDRYGSVISQSGSFWWPHVELLAALPGQPCPRRSGASGALAQQVAKVASPQQRLRIFQEVGSNEDVMIDVNDSMHAALVDAEHEVLYQQFTGGHDWSCWRGGLLDGLAHLLPAHAQPHSISSCETTQ